MATKIAADLEEALFSDDPEYNAMFDVKKQSINAGTDESKDYTNDLNAVREKGGVQKGSMRSHLGLEGNTFENMGSDQFFTFYSYRANETGWRENTLFSSEGYNRMSTFKIIGPTILSMVGKQHKRLRATAQPLFKRPRVLGWWNARFIQDTADALLNRIAGAGNDRVDLNADLCAPMPMAVISRAIGLEGANVIEFRFHLHRSTFGSPDTPIEDRLKSFEYVDRVLDEMVEKNLKEPGDNVISSLMENDLTEEDGSTRKLTKEELYGFCKLVIFAGGGTTWRQLGITIYALLSNYHFWEACRDDRTLIEQAVDESLRWGATDPVFPRLCVEDTEVEGVFIPANSQVQLCLGTANHDPELFENPTAYDIFRKKEHHMGFGFGPHRCLGMDVAKQEMVLAINGLMDRFPNLRLDPGERAPILGGLEHRGMTALPVTLQ
ncbi:MAG: cytochrome P450 [Sphingomonadaceae bacterium]|nr:cytochrome P450 [Sphingomonadaceae bacterium]